MPVRRLGRALVTDGTLARVEGLGAPDATLLDLPERAVQFGTGALLRGFVDAILDDANRRGAFAGRVVAVASTASGRTDAINDQDGLYTLVVQGIDADGPRADARAAARADARVIGAVSRALSAATEWDAVLALARDPALRLVFSNTTEIGIVLDPSDEPDAGPPRSFPGKLARFLYERGRASGFDPAAGVVVLPCELIERNGDRLREVVDALARRWRLDPAFTDWLDAAVPFCNTLVDRIVPGRPPAEEAAALERRSGYTDAMLTACEIYRLFAIEGDAALRDRLGFAAGDPTVIVAADITPYRERKVRLLNGAHTITVSLALLCGCVTVRDAVAHELVGRFLRLALLDEILPSVDYPDAAAFAHDVLRRFANPYLRHALADITLQGTTKMRVRVIPSILAYVARVERVPTSLALGFAAYLWLLRGDAGLTLLPDDLAPRVREHWAASGADLDRLAARVAGDRALWGTDLNEVPGFTEAVAGHLARLAATGAAGALEAHLAEAISA